MGVTNRQHCINTIIQLVNDGAPDFRIHLRKFNTGSYIYNVSAIRSNSGNIEYEVLKTNKSGKNLGRTIWSVTYFGAQTANAMFNTPDSIKQYIHEFNRELLIKSETKRN